MQVFIEAFRNIKTGYVLKETRHIQYIHAKALGFFAVGQFAV